MDIKSKNLNVNLCPSENFRAYLVGNNIQVFIGQAAQIEVGAAINYIESGKNELQPLADHAKQYANEA